MQTKVKEYLDANELNADNAEDLSTWCAEQFELTDEEFDEAYHYCRDYLNMTK